MEVVTCDKYLELLVKFIEKKAGALIEGTQVLKLNPVGLHYVHSRLESLNELERLISGAPVDYLRAYISDLGDHRALEQLRRILCRLNSLKIVSTLPSPMRDPTPLSLLVFGRLKVLELRGCDLSTSAAKPLLDLRLTLEKLICHNSTDALRHVFADRIADIKESPQWNRLSFVSCACNGLILMDESLQLLPSVEVLDLSRNKFSKVDNLRKCSKLKHLDLGFNQLRSVASLGEVMCHISKLVLRSNALTTLRGIETLKLLEGLDVSYNIISNLSELEVLSSLSSLKSLWLEGNPLCCARWYRPHVFSFFVCPQQVKLDDREMSTKEYLKRQIIVARRQRRPSSYGFYSPARQDNEWDGLTNGKRKKLSRLACIESEEHGMNLLFEQDSLSCDNDIQDGDDSTVSDNESEITSLINRIESMKKERSRLWLEDFKDWMDQGSDNLVHEDNSGQSMLVFGRRKLTDKSGWGHIGETSRYPGYASDSTIVSVDDKGTNFPESNSSGSFVGKHADLSVDSAFENGKIKPVTMSKDLEEDLYTYQKMTDNNSRTTNADVGVDVMNLGAAAAMPSTDINSTVAPCLPSILPRSPPHYQEDILLRCHFLEEEFLQLSAESISVASSDSDTSCDEGDGHAPLPTYGKSVREELGCETNLQSSSLLAGKDDIKCCVSGMGVDGSTPDLCNESDHSSGFSCDVPSLCNIETTNKYVANSDDLPTSNKENQECYNKKNFKRRPAKRIVLLSEHSLCSHGDDAEDEFNSSTNDNNCSLDHVEN